MTHEATIQLAIVVPLVGAVLIGLTGRSPNLRETVTLVTAGLLFLLVASLVPAVAEGGRPRAEVLQMLPGLAIAFEVEPLGMMFAGIASFLWIVTSIYSIGYMRGHHEVNQTRFYVCFAIALSSAVGVAFAANMFTLFIFYEVLTVSTYPLVTHHGTDEAKAAGRTYLGILLGTSIGLQLLAVIWTWTLSGTLDFVPGGILGGKASPAVTSALLLLYVFGIGKAALMPLHRCLPAAMVAPTPVSALLHAVAVVKAGVFSVLKVTVYVFGLETISDLASREFLAYVAGATILIASLTAMTKDNLKARLAYSTISQLSYVVLGAMLANSWGVVGGAMHIVMHAFGKITLFFCAGAIMVAAHKTEVSQLTGLGRRMPFTFLAFLIGALSVTGLPPMGGTWSKWYLALGAVDAGYLTLVAVLMVSSLLNVAYLLPIPGRGFFVPAAEPDAHAAPASVGAAAAHGAEATGIREAPLLCVVPLCLTAAGCFALFVFADRIYEFLLPIAQQ